MMKFFDNFTYEGRWNFFIRYFLPLLIIFFFWIFIGNLIETYYTKDNLNKITGQIIMLNEVQTLNSKKAQDFELRLILNSYPKYFRITDNFDYHKILQLKIGDEVQVYFRPKYLVAIGMGKQSDIYQLEYKKEILYDLNSRKRNSKGLIIISSIFLLVFGTVYHFASRSLPKKATANRL